MTLNEVMTQTADAIREKKGTTEKIAPVNFAEEIKPISAGGGESGGSNSDPLAYIEVTEAFTNDEMFKMLNPIAFKAGNGRVYPASEAGGKFVENNVQAIAIALNIKILTLDDGRIVTVPELLEAEGIPLDQIISMLGSRYMTAEEFYGTNQMVSQ